MKKLRKMRGFVAVLLAVMILTAFYSRYIEPELLIVKKITVETEIDIEECRAVFFTDTHFGQLYHERHMERIVDTINRLDADLVIFGGDLLDDYGRDREILNMEYLGNEMGRIRAREGKYAVFGNHDYGGGAFKIYEDFLSGCGFRVLVNECVALRAHNMDIIGFDDYLFGYTEPDFYQMQGGRFHLVVAHEPVISKLIAGFGDNFVLAGHTHGGQVSVPYFTGKQIPAGSDEFIKGYYGAKEIGTGVLTQMYVSSGIGLTKYPFRLFNIPEIIEVDFVKRG